MKKFISIMLALLMAWMTVPITVFATEDEGLTSILGYGNNNDNTIIYANDVTINEDILNEGSISDNSHLNSWDVQVNEDIPLADGIYKIKNLYNGLYASVYNPGYESNTSVVQCEDVTKIGMSEMEANQLFKITYLKTYNSVAYYSIRPMTNSALGLYSGYDNMENVTVRSMQTEDNWSIDYTQCWYITQDGNAFTIRNGPSYINNYLTASDNLNNNAPIVTYMTPGSITDLSRWLFEPYTGSAIDKVAMSNFSLGVKCGTSFDYDAYMCSSQINVNGPVTYTVANMDYSATDKAIINSSSGELTALKQGTIKVGVTYSNAPWVWWWIVEITTENGWRQVEIPDIQARETWGARPVAENRLVDRTRSPERIIFHHSADKFSKTDINSVIAEIQRIQNVHMDAEYPKCDIAYHYIIDPAGRIWEGAEIDDYQRGHATGYYDDIGVLVLGDFQPRLLNVWNPNELNQNQKNAMEVLAKWLCYEYDLPVITTGEGIAPISTHRTVTDTECPGERMATWVENELRNIINNWNLG